MTEEKLQEIADEYGLYTEQDVKNRLSCELLQIGARNEELEKENAELIKDKAYAEEQLDKQIEATLKLQKEYNNLKETNAILSESAAINQKDLEYKVSVIEQRNKKIAELEAQIEKMKCCGNCAKNGHICVAEEMQGKLCGKNKDKWELRR